MCIFLENCKILNFGKLIAKTLHPDLLNQNQNVYFVAYTTQQYNSAGNTILQCNKQLRRDQGSSSQAAALC